MNNPELLVKELIGLPSETGWVEFKHNNYSPEMIAKDISALANSAILDDRNTSYMIWGIDDKTHEIIGTNQNLLSIKKGNEELESWLKHQMSKNFDFSFVTTCINDKPIGIIEIISSLNTPVTFEKEAFVRIGSYTKPLRDFPNIEAQLWNKLTQQNFESLPALTDLELSDALTIIDYTVYFDLTQTKLPSNNEQISHYLLEDGIIYKQDDGLFSITNLGAILFAKKLSIFDRISRKAIRIVQYSGTNKIKMLREETIEQGYAVGFENLIRYVEALTPSEENISDGIRRRITAYPTLAIREAIGNAIIHQDFSITGTGPTIEVFENRIEITNPGTPLVLIERIIDNPPKSRNEKMAALMRRMKICEELGTGWDKIVIATEFYQLPAPKIVAYEESTKVTLFSKISFQNITPEDKLRAVYLHSCIKQVSGDYLTNSSLRNRFGLKESSAGTISRLIKDAIEKGAIKPLDPDTAPRYMKYQPWWA